jgi:heme oxygenase
MDDLTLEELKYLRELTRTDPARLLAHAWLRYLGDLNGGQIIGRIVRDSLGLPVDAAQFYEFPLLADPMAAAAEWRVALDAAPLTPPMHDAIIDEACDGFLRHIRLFASLAPVLDANA